MYNLPDLKTARVDGKRVFLRTDLDVPILNEEQITNNESQIADDTRLTDGLETLKYLLDNGAHVIVAGHLGRPQEKLQTAESAEVASKNFHVHNAGDSSLNQNADGANARSENFESSPHSLDADLIVSTLSLKPIAEWYARKFSSNAKAGKLGEFEGWQIMPNLYLLENLRFYPEEEANPSTSSGQAFAQRLASLAEIYVNDAFASSHRAHASIVGIAKLLPHYAGFMLVREINVLATLMEDPKRPMTVIIGGAKIETKLPVVEKMHQIADYVLIGGLIADQTKTLLKVQHERTENRKSALIVGDLVLDKTDMTANSIENFLQIVNLSQTVIWNGQVGITEGREDNPEIASAKLARGIAESGAYTVVGGGDTIGFLKKIGLLDKFSFVSTGGGAMLEFLSGEKLPGIEALVY